METKIERRSRDAHFVEKVHDFHEWTYIDRRASRGMLEIWYFGIDVYNRAICIVCYVRLICRSDLPDGGVWGKWSTQDGGWDAEDLTLLGFSEEDVPPEPQDVIEEGVRDLLASMSFKSNRGAVVP